MIHLGPRNESSFDPRAARCERIIALARTSFATSDGDICSVLTVRSMNGAARRPSGVDASENSPGSPAVATISPTLRTRAPDPLSRYVPSVTSTSVAMNASGGTPMSNTILW